MNGSQIYIPMAVNMLNIDIYILLITMFLVLISLHIFLNK